MYTAFTVDKKASASPISSHPFNNSVREKWRVESETKLRRVICCVKHATAERRGTPDAFLQFGHVVLARASVPKPGKDSGLNSLALAIVDTQMRLRGSLNALVAF